LDIDGGDDRFGRRCCGDTCCCAYHFGSHLIETHALSGEVAFAVFVSLDEGLEVTFRYNPSANEVIEGVYVQLRF
jgi:hypothetical protein